MEPQNGPTKEESVVLVAMTGRETSKAFVPYTCVRQAYAHMRFRRKLVLCLAIERPEDRPRLLQVSAFVEKRNPQRSDCCSVVLGEQCLSGSG